MCRKQFYVGLICYLSIATAPALESDVNQTIEIRADSMQLNEQSGTTRYEGNVSLVQGSVFVTANLIVLTTLNSKLQHMKITGTNDRPAVFQQKMESGQLARGQARLIEYNIKNSQLLFKGQAELKQGSRFIRSEHIKYNMESNNLSAGKNTKLETDAPQNDRVHIVITPDQP